MSYLKLRIRWVVGSFSAGCSCSSRVAPGPGPGTRRVVRTRPWASVLENSLIELNYIEHSFETVGQAQALNRSGARDRKES